MYYFDTFNDLKSLIISDGGLDMHLFRHYSGKIMIERRHRDGTHDSTLVDRKDIYGFPFINEAFIALSGECIIWSSRAKVEQTITNILGYVA